MKKTLLISLVLLLSGAICMQSISSCNKKHRRDQQDSAFTKGKVIPYIECKKDFSQSYALYLPSYYSEDKKWPVVYAFDSHGKGSLPVELFKGEAEKYGYIIVGSNNSKNGTPWETTSVLYDTLYSDTHRRLSIDNSRVYTAGFSGGSRVASSVAISKGGINSVIGCGAGFGSQEHPAQKFNYFGIAGNVDMNLNEMITLDSALEKSGYKHYLEKFNGKHEWPPKTVVSDAFLWLELRAMNDKLKPTNDTLVKNTFTRWNKEYLTLSDSGKFYKAYLLCGKIINFFDGVKDVTTLKADLKKLSENAAVISAKKHLQVISFEEAALQSHYMNALSTQTTAWWANEVTLINGKINASTDNEEKFMYKRVLNYLSLVTYMNINALLKSAQFEEALKFNTIYALVDPENPEHAYISATLSMKNHKSADAMSFLETAAKLGFAEPDRLESDTVMSTLKDQPKYSGILDSIKNNANKK